MKELDLLRTETEDDLRTTVRHLLARRCEPSAVVAMYDGDRSVVDGLWKALSVDLGSAASSCPRITAAQARERARQPS